MSGVPTLIKQPGENRLYSMDFAPNLDEGETVSSIISVIATPPGLTLSGPAGTNGTKATQRILGGTNNALYKVTFTVLTSAGNTLESEGNLRVREL